MNQIAWFLRLSLDGSFTSELNRKRQACSPMEEGDPGTVSQGIYSYGLGRGDGQGGPYIRGALLCPFYLYVKL